MRTGCPQLLNSLALAGGREIKFPSEFVGITRLALGNGLPIDFGIIGGICASVNK
jgi:hypothetical protein